MVSVISAAHCVYQGNKEDILILANSLANVIGKNKRFGETTHHVDEIRLHEDYARGKTRVSVQGVKSLGGHFACLCQGFEFYEEKFFFFMLLFFKKKMEILLHF